MQVGEWVRRGGLVGVRADAVVAQRLEHVALASRAILFPFLTARDGLHWQAAGVSAFAASGVSSWVVKAAC